MVACRLGQEAALAELIRSRADCTVGDEFRDTAVNRAARGGHPGIIKQLVVQGVDVNVTDTEVRARARSQ